MWKTQTWTGFDAGKLFTPCLVQVIKEGKKTEKNKTKQNKNKIKTVSFWGTSGHCSAVSVGVHERCALMSVCYRVQGQACGRGTERDPEKMTVTRGKKDFSASSHFSVTARCHFFGRQKVGALSLSWLWFHCFWFRHLQYIPWQSAATFLSVNCASQQHFCLIFGVMFARPVAHKICQSHNNFSQLCHRRQFSLNCLCNYYKFMEMWARGG